MSVKDQIARVEAIADAVESPTFSVQFGPNGPQWCSDALLAAIAERSRATGRRVHMHLLETRYQRAASDRLYPEGAAARLKALGLLSPRLTLAHCVWARNEDLDLIAESGAIVATNPSSNLHLASGVAPIGEAIRRGCRVAIGVDASALDEDDDIVREMRLGHFLHGGWGFEKVVERGDWLSRHRRERALRQWRAGRRRASRGRAGRYPRHRSRRARPRRGHGRRADRSPVCARDERRMSTRLIVAGREIVRDGRLRGSTSRRGKRSCAPNFAARCRRARRSFPPGTISNRPSSTSTATA